MILIITLTLCCFLIAYWGNKFHIPYNNLFLSAGLICIMGLRYEVGIDYPVYMDIYNNPYSIHALFIEPIWNMIIKVMRSLGFQSRAFFFLTSLLTFLGFYYGIKKMSPHFYMSLFLLLICGFYFESANLIRQYVAISLLFAGFHFFLDGNIWKYMIWIAIAACFHTSVLFIAPLILLNRLKYPTFILLIILGISHIFGDKILSILINNIMPFLQDINSYQYAIDDFDSGANSGLLRIFYYIIVCSIIILYTKFRKKSPLHIYIFINMTVSGLIIYNICYSFMPARRLYLYFFPYIIILIPYYINWFKYSSRFIVMGIISSGFLLFLFKIYINTTYSFDIKFF